MEPALTDPRPVHGASEATDELCALPLHDRLRLVRELAEQLAALHGGGRVHRAIDRVVVLPGERPRLQLPDPPPRRRFGGDHSDAEYCPPELATADTLELPDDVDVATRLLRKSGHGLDPRQIDLYQLGALLCRLLTGDSIHSYMLSPTTKANVPASAREVLARSVGFDAGSRFDDSAALMAAVDDAVRKASPAPAPDADTQPGARALARADDTPVERHRRDSMVREPAALPFQRLGDLEIVAHLGRGGMGDVYKGYDETLRRSVAVKVLPPELARDAKFVERFHAEATAVARLDHPNVVSIHCIGEEAGYHYFAMQYVEGEALAARLRGQKRLSLAETLDVVGQCLAGLQAAHNEGLVHRDIKPGNILIERDTHRVVLVDFGLVRVLDDISRITSAGTVLGTVDYISPEQARGEKVDARADLYSIGILMYQLLSGELPFSAETPTGMMYQHTHSRARPLSELAPEVPLELEAVVRRLMAKEPGDRYQTAAEALEALRTLQRSIDRPAPHGRPKRRLSRPWALASAVLLLVAVVLSATWIGGPAWLSGDAVQPTDGPEMVAETSPSGTSDAGNSVAGTPGVEESGAVPPSVVLAPGDGLPRRQWVDALTYVDLDWHVVSGRWRRDAEGLTTDLVRECMSRVMLPFEINGSYDLKAEFTRLSGAGSVNVLLPVGKRTCRFTLAGFGQTLHGLGMIDGKTAGNKANPAVWRPGQLTNERRHRVSISVRTERDEATIEVTLDGKTILTWTGKQNSLGVPASWTLPYPRRVAIGAHDSPVTFHDVSLRSVIGKTRRAPLPAPPFEDAPDAKWVNLLANVDLSRDTIRGQWCHASDGVAVAPGSQEKPTMRLMLPKVVEGSYDLVAEFTRTKGSDSVAIMLPVSGRACTLQFSARAGRDTGLGRIDGIAITDQHSPAVRRPGQVLNNRVHKALVSVRQLNPSQTDDPDVLIDVWLDGRPCVRWLGRASSLDNQSWELPERRRVGLGSHQSLVTFHDVRLRPAPHQ